MYPLVDAHTHLWLSQNTEVAGMPIRTLTQGRSLFMGEVRQMLPPFLVDGRNTAEVLLSNMNYAQVSAAVVTQEYIDGMQNEYLLEVQQKYPNRLLCCGMPDARKPGYLEQGMALVAQGFRAIKIPAGRLIDHNQRTRLTNPHMMALFKHMEARQVILSIDLADGNEQVAEMHEVIGECPQLKIAIGHFGMVTRPNWHEQIKLARHTHVQIESGGITWLFHHEFYPFAGAVRAIREAAELVGMNKLMWGSDYPRTLTAITYRMSYDFVLKTTELTDNEKADFLGRNAQRFYSLSNLPQLPYIKSMVE